LGAAAMACVMVDAPRWGNRMSRAYTISTGHVIRYVAALGLSVAALIVRFVLDPILGDRLSYCTFWLATAIAVWRLGVGPAILTTMLGLAMGFYFFVQPRYTFLTAMPFDFAVILAYLLVCAIICALGGLMRRANNQLKATATIALEQKERVEREVSERKRSEALLRGIFDSAPVGIWIVDRDGYIATTNAASDHIWAMDKRRGVRKVDHCIGWIPQTGEKLTASDWPVSKVLAKGETVLDQEIEIESFDGTCRCVVNSAVPLHDEGGAVSGALSVFYDITRRKQAESDLARQTARIRVLHEAAAQLLSMTDPGDVIQQIYRKVGGYFGADVFLEYAIDISGVSRELVTAGGIPSDAQSRLKHVQFADAFCRSIPETKQPVRAYNVNQSDEPALQIMKELGVRAYSCHPLMVGDRLLGTLAFASRSKNAFDAADEEVFQTLAHYVSIARDRWRLTASLHQYTHDLETAVQERTARLEESSVRLRGIVETAVDAIITLNDHHELETVNPATEQMFGYKRDELVGTDVRLFFAEPSRSRCIGNLDHYIATGEGDVLGTTHEMTGLRKDGTTFPIQLTVGEGRLPNKRFFTAILRDVTARKKAEQRLQERNFELEQLSYSIIHDMRAPLRAMRSFGQMLQEEAATALDAESKDFLQRIIDSAHRMDQLITDVFNFTTFMREGLPLSRLNPKPLLNEIIGSYPDFHPSRADIQVAERFDDVLANRGGLTQCFSHLLNNAVKFAKPGQKPVVRIWSELSSDRVRIWFEDEGIGIDPRHKERIFEMFQKLETKSMGTGIGLALVRKACEKMDGRCGVESEPGKGSRFWMELLAAERAAKLK
jgi:two-component system sensor kinase FixL